MDLKKINEIIDKYKSDDYSGDVVFEYIPEYNFKEFANELLKAIKYNLCCKSDSEQLFCYPCQAWTEHKDVAEKSFRCTMCGNMKAK